MIEITFLTSNNVKLAHAKHLSRNWDVNIIQHKLKHYGVGYEEPRLFKRDILLEESVKDAIIRWKRNISDQENRFYFLEDTSVTFHSLSTKNEEVPGVDIKYWMRENTFEKIDNLLKVRGNNREVTVFSHVVLVLTKDLKEKYGEDYIIFKSKSDGHFVESEKVFETNILYPWLDNVTFNKWFVPHGEVVPISLLPIEKADLYDFRRGAFDSLFRFLEVNKKIHKRRNKEVQLRFLSNPILIISGPTCAGKTTIGKFLIENYGYYHIEASDFMAMEYIQTHGHSAKFSIGEFAKEILKKRPYIIAEKILTYIETINKLDSIVVTGFRSPLEIQYFLKNSSYRGKFKILFIQANYDTRFERWIKRNRDISDNSKSKFDKINEIQKEMGVENISELDNISIIRNNKTLEDYFNLIESAFLSNIVPNSQLEHTVFEDIVPKHLEDAIIFSLALDYKNDKQEYLTTTEISRKINETFLYLDKDKHKDNVSRYFNQKIYPYYEVKLVVEKIKYRLSPTGYSYAMSLLKIKYIKN